MSHLGIDFAGHADIDSSWSTTVTGRQALVGSIFRRLRTPRGRLQLIGGDPTYGYDLTMMVGSIVRIGEIEQRVAQQVLADERVEDAEVTATYSAPTSTLTVRIGVTDGDGPFEFVIKVSDVSVELYFSEAV